MIIAASGIPTTVCRMMYSFISILPTIYHHDFVSSKPLMVLVVVIIGTVPECTYLGAITGYSYSQVPISASLTLPAADCFLTRLELNNQRAFTISLQHMCTYLHVNNKCRYNQCQTHKWSHATTMSAKYCSDQISQRYIYSGVYLYGDHQKLQ